MSRRSFLRALLTPALLSLTVLMTLAWQRSAFEAPQATALLLDREDSFLAEVGAKDDTSGYGYWEVEQIPKRVAAATLAVEDRRFYGHPGVDPISIVRALWQNLTSGKRVSGASTIAMQVARMQRSGSRTLSRKVLEALTALIMTARHGREGMLSQYLKIVPYGNQVHGIAYAARRYLDKPVEDLSWAEVAYLTAVPQAPARHNPLTRSGRASAIGRAKRILKLLLDGDELTAQEHAIAYAELEEIQLPEKGKRDPSALHSVLSVEQAHRRGELDGKLVQTTIDSGLQKSLSEFVGTTVSRWKSFGVGNAALLVVERDTMQVRAWVGSAGYFDEERAGAIDYAKIKRSPGSALKPFLYALALEEGVITPATILDDLGRGPGGVENSDKRFLGPLLPRKALANSRNVPAVLLADKLGGGRVFGLLEALNLDEVASPAADYGLGVAIGSFPVTLEGLVTAYGALANDGLHTGLTLLRGEEGEGQRVFSEEAARQISLMLSDPQARMPTFKRGGYLDFDFPVAIKTGTSSRCRDAWTVGYTKDYIVGAWVGHPDYRPMRGMGGSTSAAYLVNATLNLLHEEEGYGLDELSFALPRGHDRAELCAISGALATDDCDEVTVESFAPGKEPQRYCDTHVKLAIDTRNGLPAGIKTPQNFRGERVFVELPPRYAVWQKLSGLEPLPSLDELALDKGEENRTLRITYPEESITLRIDPSVPSKYATLALSAVVDPPSEQLVWFVDGKPFRVVDYPYTARWNLSSGTHVFQAQLPYSDLRSKPVKVLVR